MPAKSPTKPRDERLEAWVSRDQKVLFQHAAELQRRTLTDFVIASVHDAAVRVIAETQTIRLSAADSRAFAEALLNPREPNARLKAVYQRFRFGFLVEGGRSLFVPAAEIAKLFAQ